MPLLYAHPDGNLRAFGSGSTVGPWTAAPLFTHRVTEPDATNTGVGTGGHRALDYSGGSADIIDGNVTLTAGQVMSNKVINGYVIGTPTSELINCHVRGQVDPPFTLTGNRALVTVADHTVTLNGPRMKITHCTIEPQTKSWYWSACVGNRGYEVTRCNLSGTTDIFGVFGQNTLGGYANVRVYDTYSPYMQYWQAESGGIVHPSTAYTHNDNAQFQGNLGGIGDVVFDGNALYARMQWESGHSPSAPRPVPAAVFNLVSTQGSGCPAEASGTYEYNWLYRTVDEVLQKATYNINLGGTGAFADARTFAFRYNRVQRPLGSSKGIVMSPAVQTNSLAYYTGNTYMDDGTTVNVQGG